MYDMSFHGTDDISASIIIGPPSNVDVTRGRGELGQGFYTGSSISLAAIWAYGRHQEKGVVVEFGIPRSELVKLDCMAFKRRSKLVELWQDLRGKKTTTTHKFGVDYVIAPFATVEEIGHQYKFESEKSQTVLNNCPKNVYPCV